MEQIERSLKDIPDDQHWWCPLRENDEADVFDDDDLREWDGPVDNMPASEKKDRILEAQARAETVSTALQALGFRSEDRVTFNNWFVERVDEQLSRCSYCIKTYHRRRKLLIENLAGEHDAELLQQFIAILSDMDLTRIRSGLLTAVELLRRAPREERSTATLDHVSLHAMLEALTSQAVLNDDAFMTAYFDEPLRLVQTRKIFRTIDYVPAMCTFLFVGKPHRREWARRCWAKMKRGPTKSEFAWVVHDPLLSAMRQVFSSPIADLVFLERFWSAVKLIVGKIGKELVTHTLRAMDIDVFRLGLDNLAMDTPAFPTILQTFKILLTMSPTDFWDAMGPISPANIIEMIFQNPQCAKILMQDVGVQEPESSSSSSSSSVDDLMCWVEPFMASLKLGSKPPACRALSAQLMERLMQNKRYPEKSRMLCFYTGLQVINATLESFVTGEVSAVARVVVLEIMEVVCKHLPTILAVISSPVDESMTPKLAPLAVQVIRNALRLDCQCLMTDYDTLKARKSLQHDKSSSTFSRTLWDAVSQALVRNELPLAQHTLLGMIDQVGLEKFNIDHDNVNTKQKILFNNAYGQVTDAISRIYGRLSDYDPDVLSVFFAQHDTASSLIAGLFSADPAIYEAATDVVKILSSQDGRMEAIAHVLSQHFVTTIECLTWTIRRISKRGTFGSNPRMLKTSGDVFEILCNAQTGLLRTRTLATAQEASQVRALWSHQWHALSVIFRMTEAWSTTNSKEVMKEFCRDVMQFADTLFDQYSIFANALTVAGAGGNDADAACKTTGSAEGNLLQQPLETLKHCAGWLRLRDEYLAGKSVSLVCKILRRLAEQGVAIDNKTLYYIGDIAVRNSLKSNLKAHEKAELVRALDAHRTPRSTGSQHKAGVIDMNAWNSKAKAATVINLVDNELDDFDDDEIIAASGSIDISKKIKAGRKPTVPTGRPIRPPSVPMASKATGNRVEIERREAFKAKREKERAEKAARDRASIAAYKGKNALALGPAYRLNGMGDPGKDHAPPAARSEMMVSSESSDGEEEEGNNGLDEELFGISKPAHVSASVKLYQDSKARARSQLERRGPVKKTKQVRTAKDMRARLAPDLSSLHQKVLGWNFFHTGDFPPDSDRQDYTMVSNTFRTPTEYQATFEPLHILEAWKGFLKSKEDAGGAKLFDVKITSRMTVDAFIELSTTIPMAAGREIGFAEADLVLLSRSKRPFQNTGEPHCLARVSKVNRRKDVMEILYRVNTFNPLVSAMSPNATLHGIKITSITPLEREYGALRGLIFYDLCEEIIKAKPSPLLQYSEKQIAPLIRTYDINPAQARAVQSAVDNDAFTLIQGPPGSGKTKTIVAIVGAIMTSTMADRGVAVARPGGVAESPPAMAKKLLVCAPSNAAVDELVMRFKGGVKTLRGESRKLSIVRLGRSDAINVAVKDVTLDELLNAKLSLVSKKRSNNSDEIHSFVEESRKLGDSMHVLRVGLDEGRTKKADAAEIAKMQHELDIQRQRKALVGRKIDELRDQGKTASRDAEINRRRAQQEILDQADVICATLSGSGHDMFQHLSIEFETVIIDEAAQSVELSALIPLKYGCSKCILVGDPKQLPPTVLSREAAGFQYEQSLFVRMQANHPQDVHLLDTQYRMHPDISRFPSQAFYESKLLDGPDMAKLREREWHQSTFLGPYRFFDVQGLHQKAAQGYSLINVAEINVALQLYERVTTDYPEYDWKQKIGIITPYKSQLRELRMRFQQRFGESIFDRVEFNTTDAFQGRESDIIIFSCVRASPHGGIGFLDDIRRMNVGLTRAKSSLWVLGNSASLIRGEFWGSLIQDARQRSCYTGGDILSLLAKPSRKTIGVATKRSCEPSKPTEVVELDIEMPDAPAVAMPTVSAVTREDVQPKAEEKPALNAHPGRSGGPSGLDDLRACHRCGSFAHMTQYCDNVGALLAIGRSCHRCEGIDHDFPTCPYERCVTCGDFGHLAARCMNPKELTIREQRDLQRREAIFRSKHSQFCADRARKQLGDHDVKVPVIRVTRRTPPPVDMARRALPVRQMEPDRGKRKREDSIGSSGVKNERGSGATKNRKGGSRPPPPPLPPPKKEKTEVPAPRAPPANGLIPAGADARRVIKPPPGTTWNESQRRPPHGNRPPPTFPSKVAAGHVSAPTLDRSKVAPPIQKAAVDPFIRPKKKKKNQQHPRP